MNLEVGKFYKRGHLGWDVFIRPTESFEVDGHIAFTGEYLSANITPNNSFVHCVKKNPLISDDKYTEISEEEFNSARELARSLI